jgi:hypothetical protein
METYKIINLDAGGKVERDATPEEIDNIKERQRKELEFLKEQIGEESFSFLYPNQIKS